MNYHALRKEATWESGNTIANSL